MSTSENVENAILQRSEKSQLISEFSQKTRIKYSGTILTLYLNILYFSTSQEVSTSELLKTRFCKEVKNNGK